MNQTNIEEIVLLSEGLVLRGLQKEGKLLGAAGRTAKVECIEMNHVKAIYPSGKEEFFTLGKNVRWIQEDGGGYNVTNLLC